ncbi:MAG: nucleoside-diphosphate kinase [Planctomycetota bacterium]|jgi:nucleoside-diphosphate kinase
MAERTLIIIKPDGIQRRLAGQLIGRFEAKGFKLVAAKFMRMSEELAGQLYAVHEGRDYYEPLVKFLSSGPVLVTVWEGERVIGVTRKMMGATFGYEAEPGTIRGDFGCSERYTLVHGSDSVESAEEEIRLFFKADETVDYELSDDEWVFGKK